MHLSLGLSAQTENTEYYIGFNDIDAESTFTWTDGSDNSYNNWDTPSGNYISSKYIIVHRRCIKSVSFL